MNVTLKQFSQQEKIAYQVCARRVKKLRVVPVAFDTAEKRGVKAFLFNYNELLKIKELKQEFLEGTMTLKKYAEATSTNLKTLASKVYCAGIDNVGETCSITGGGRKAKLYNISDLNKLREE